MMTGRHWTNTVPTRTQSRTFCLLSVPPNSPVRSKKMTFFNSSFLHIIMSSWKYEKAHLKTGAISKLICIFSSECEVLILRWRESRGLLMKLDVGFEWSQTLSRPLVHFQQLSRLYLCLTSNSQTHRSSRMWKEDIMPEWCYPIIFHWVNSII